MQDSHIHIGSLYQLFLEETQPFRKVHRMIDLFESIIKSHSVVILSEYVNHNQLSEAAKGMLSVGLRTPSLGTWQLFARVLFEELKSIDSMITYLLKFLYTNYTWFFLTGSIYYISRNSIKFLITYRIYSTWS